MGLLALNKNYHEEYPSMRLSFPHNTNVKWSFQGYLVTAELL